MGIGILAAKECILILLKSKLFHVEKNGDISLAQAVDYRLQELE